MKFRLAMMLAALLIASGCVSFPKSVPASTTPRLEGDAIVSVDGARLGLTVWRAEDPVAAIIAVHGMNDYAGAFAYAGPYWSGRGFSVYAYDQRGFGRSPDFGRWAGGGAMKQDLRAVIEAVRAEHPESPVYLVGHSMGAATILAAMKDTQLDVDGAILGAPGIWGGASMPVFYRATLNLAAMVAPGKTLTGERAGRQASDNIEFLRAMYDDPLVIKETRIDAILGAERLMGAGYDAADEASGDILFLYGEKDDIIPVKQLRKAARRLCANASVVAYPDGWHMIFADLEREKPLRDAADWIRADIAGRKDWRPQGGKGISGAAASSCAGPKG